MVFLSLKLAGILLMDHDKIIDDMIYKLTIQDKKLKGEIFLPSSKSITNRVLIMRAFCPEKVVLRNISDSEDTQVLKAAIENTPEIIDIGHAGTAMRFSTAFFATQPGSWTITGSERMKNRPIRALVDALQKLGAQIEYLEKEGYPPLQIEGKKLEENYVEIEGNISSQYITALLMIAPWLENGLTIRLKNKIISASYIKMTLQLMEMFKIRHSWTGDTIKIDHQPYKSADIDIEADWSGASYWYQMVALAEEADITIHRLYKNSTQGDAVIAKLFKKIGVRTEFLKDGVRLTKKEVNRQLFSFDFIENPDMAQTLAVTLVMLGIPFRFTGTETLRIKETDRIAALQNELGKFGAKIESPIDNELSWNGEIALPVDQNPVIQTYDDHRMALAFAPVALTKKMVQISDPKVVVKSYPTYWDDLKSIGFQIEEA
jgi:3-phosphoshikimate 1-carboxyvinyltransferase